MQKFIIPEPGPLPCSASITGQDAKHIFKVLRLKTGDHMDITNGKGQDFKARITATSPQQIDIAIFKKIKTITESPASITLCCGMLKDKKMDMIIKHVTQLGINQWIPFYCKRSVPRHNPGKIGSRLKRWETIAKESLKQCQRSALPKILSPVSFKQMLDETRQTPLKIVFWEKETHKFLLPDTTQTPPKISVLIGPEGGFTKEEIDLAATYGYRSCSLGPRILRAETAAITAASIIQHHFGDL